MVGSPEAASDGTTVLILTCRERTGSAGGIWRLYADATEPQRGLLSVGAGPADATAVANSSVRISYVASQAMAAEGGSLSAGHVVLTVGGESQATGRTDAGTVLLSCIRS